MNDKNTPVYGKKTVIVGASASRHGYAALAYHMLKEYNHEIVLLGKRPGAFEGTEILDIHQTPVITDIDTITLYINPSNQERWHQYLVDLKPARIIFNPGAENDVLRKLATEKGIETVYGCTLVMLRVGSY